MDQVPSPGFELVSGYAWNITRISSEHVLLWLTHPRFGELRYVMFVSEAQRMADFLQRATAASANPLAVPEGQKPS